MKRRWLVALGMIAAVALTAGCVSVVPEPGVVGSGRVITESRTLPTFRSLDVRGPFEVMVQVEPDVSVSVTSDDNIVPLISTVVSDQRLTISLRPGNSVTATSGLRVELSTPSLNDVTGHAASRIRVTALAGPRFVAELAEASELIAAGAVDQLVITGRSASSARLGDLRLRAAHVDLAEGSVAELSVTESVTGRAASASVLVLHQAPDRVTVSTSEASQVIRR
jgi:hypothetical protein